MSYLDGNDMKTGSKSQIQSTKKTEKKGTVGVE